jgi:hypothetical protein
MNTVRKQQLFIAYDVFFGVGYNRNISWSVNHANLSNIN